MLEEAMKVLSVPAKDLQEFEVEDPFNPPHVLRGFLCRRPDHRYGAMYVTHVDDAEEPQLIFATPKLHYPFDRAGTYRFPPAREVLVYEKLDGTNVLAYFYRRRGQKFLTFKLRLAPVVRNSRHGPFLDFWREILAVHPDILKLPAVNDCAISFELYGGRNKHLVVYDAPLSVAVLFGVGPTGTIRPPADLQLLNVPASPLMARLESAIDYQQMYASQQGACEQSNEMLDDGAVRGTEGRVWYMRTLTGDVVMFKCKPESVEQIHFAAGAGLSKNVIRATAYNVLETETEITCEGVTTLLLEEFSEEDIERNRALIAQVVDEVRAEMQFREHVLSLFDPLGLDLATQKSQVMRALSVHFPREQMKKVYALLVQERSG
jgi:hypothetical protein